MIQENIKDFLKTNSLKEIKQIKNDLNLLKGRTIFKTDEERKIGKKLRIQKYVKKNKDKIKKIQKKYQDKRKFNK